MNLRDHLREDLIFYLNQDGKTQAIRELVERTCTRIPALDCRQTLQAVEDRESVVSSWVAPGIAIPHARLPNLRGFIISIGVSREGIHYESVDGKPVHLLILILGEARSADRHIQLLAEVARTFRSESIRQAVRSAPSAHEIYQILENPQILTKKMEPGAKAGINELFLSHALALAGQAKAEAILLHVDALHDLNCLESLKTETKILLVTSRTEIDTGALSFPYRIIHLPFSGLNRANQADLALLLSLGHRYLAGEDRIVSLFGQPDSGVLDSLMVIDLSRELPTFLHTYPTDLLGDVAPEVLERVLQIATTISREGREGKAIGTTFVVGDYSQVRTMSRQLVINPFKGYTDEERSILDPSLEETLKEFATIDGAFLIRGDGVVEAAGTYLRPDVAVENLPSGLGARHAAAAGITAATEALAVVISQSTGRVGLFKAGRSILYLDRPRG
jgi:DNA integrity scanning protein DisA with diadenylate cyclase activity/mannitol/fructose-specific phosphotransferase system IIA component (Ntr-type)